MAGSCSTARQHAGRRARERSAPAMRAARDAPLAAGKRPHPGVGDASDCSGAGGRAGGAVGHAARRRGLLVRSFHALARVEPGFETSRRAGLPHERELERDRGRTRPWSRAWTARSTRSRAAGRRWGGHHRLGLPGAPTDGSRARGRGAAATPTGASSPNFAWCRRSISRPCGSPSRAAASGAPSAARGPAGLDGEPRVRGPPPVGLSVGRGAASSSSGHADSAPARIVGVVGDAREQGIDRVPVPVVYSCLSAPGPTPLPGADERRAARSRWPCGADEGARAAASVYDIALLDERIDDAYTCAGCARCCWRCSLCGAVPRLRRASTGR